MKEEKLCIAREIIRRQDIAAVLAERGVSEEAFVEWLEEGEVASYLYRMAKTKAMARIPEVWLALERLVKEGNVKAIKLYCELCEKMREEGTDGGEDAGNPEVEAIRREIFGDE